jgi:hypothetical protein
MVVHRHFAEPRPGYVAINIFGYYPNRRKLYNLHQSLEAWFFNAMLTHVQIAVQLGHPAKTALSAFLARNRISEGELSIHTAYKRWQRLGRAGLPGIKAI